MAGTDPEGARPWLGALLLAYYDPTGWLVYAGRVGAGIDNAELGRLWRRLQPLATSEMPLDRAPPRSNRFGSPLVLIRVHWVRPELVVEVKYLTWTQDSLLRQVAYQGVREDKDPSEVRRPGPVAELGGAGWRHSEVGPRLQLARSRGTPAGLFWGIEPAICAVISDRRRGE